MSAPRPSPSHKGPPRPNASPPSASGRPGHTDGSPAELLVFMMGQFEATFPTDRRYTTHHMWASASLTPDGGDGRLRFGLTSYAVRLLQDVYFLDWVVEPPVDLDRRQLIGAIESKKAESDLYAPTAGQLVALNRVALDDPSVINVETYDQGWLFEMIPQDPRDLLDPAAYLEHLEQAWVVAQRTIKGQV